MENKNQVHGSWQIMCGVGALNKLKSYAGVYLKHGRGDLKGIRNSYHTEENRSPWYTLKQGSYYLNHVYRFLECYKNCVPGEIQDENVKKVEETMEFLQFDRIHITCRMISSSGHEPYICSSEGSFTTIFDSKGEGAKYHEMLHSKKCSDVIAFLALVDKKIDTSIEHFYEEVNKRLLEINGTETPNLSELFFDSIVKKNVFELDCLLRYFKFDENCLQLSDGITPLHYAVMNNCKDSVLTLLPKSSFKPNIKGETPIHTAMSHNYEEVAGILLQNLTEMKQRKDLLQVLDARSNTGFTALHVAVTSKSYKMVKTLLELGAVFDVKTNSDYTALQLSQNASISGILSLIENLFDSADKGDTITVLSLLKEISVSEKPSVLQARNSGGKTLLELVADKASAYKAILRELIELM